MNTELLISGLEQGHEYCGICGKDVTGQPDCVHNATMRDCSTASGLTINRAGILCKDRVIRVGMEYLMYLSELAYLPMFDSVSVIQSRIDNETNGLYRRR